MLIKKIYKRIYGLPIWYTYMSDAKMYIRRVETGKLIPFAIDRPIPKYTYEETDIPLPVREKKTVVKETIKEE